MQVLFSHIAPRKIFHLHVKGADRQEIDHALLIHFDEMIQTHQLSHRETKLRVQTFVGLAVRDSGDLVLALQRRIVQDGDGFCQLHRLQTGAQIDTESLKGPGRESAIVRERVGAREKERRRVREIERETHNAN